MVEVREKYSDEVRLGAIKQLVCDIKDLVERELEIETTLLHQEAKFVEYFMTSPEYFLLKKKVTTTEEYRTWFGLGSKRTREIISEGQQVFGFALEDRTTFRCEIFKPEILEPITEMAKNFADKYDFSRVIIVRQYAD
jgi:hypothetical protein